MTHRASLSAICGVLRTLAQRCELVQAGAHIECVSVRDSVCRTKAPFLSARRRACAWSRRACSRPAHAVFNLRAWLLARCSRVQRCSPQPHARRGAAASRTAPLDVCVQRSRACACAATSLARCSRCSSALCRPRCPVRTSLLCDCACETKHLLALQRRTAVAARRSAASRYSHTPAALLPRLTRSSVQPTSRRCTTSWLRSRTPSRSRRAAQASVRFAAEPTPQRRASSASCVTGRARRSCPASRRTWRSWVRSV